MILIGRSPVEIGWTQRDERGMWTGGFVEENHLDYFSMFFPMPDPRAQCQTMTWSSERDVQD